VNVLQLVLLMTVAATILLWKPDVQPFAARRFLPLLVAGTFTSMFVAGNPALGVADLALRIPAWTKARSAALDTLASFAGSRRAASFPELPPVPHMYFDYDASIDPREYPNLCLARYYNLESVTGTRRPLSIRGAAYSGRSWGLLDRAPSETSR
jgi:hypothetical protein